MTTNVYLIEDHPALRKALTDFLNQLPDIQVCGIAETAQEALDHLPKCAADIALVNVSLPDMKGVDLVQELHKRWPQLRCIMVSSAEHRFYAQEALALGARGYVVKGEPTELAEAIQSVLAGNIYLSSQLHVFDDC